MTAQNPQQIETELSDLKLAYSVGPLDPQRKLQIDAIRAQFLGVAQDITLNVPYNRARSLALTNLQQAKMWAVQAVVDGPAKQ